MYCTDSSKNFSCNSWAKKIPKLKIGRLPRILGWALDPNDSFPWAVRPVEQYPLHYTTLEALACTLLLLPPPPTELLEGC